MSSSPFQPQLPRFAAEEVKDKGEPFANGKANKLARKDRAFHDWYRFVLSYPPHLVRSYIKRFELQEGQTILDPFAGAGTTIVEAKLCGLKGVGVEANPFAQFASSVKLNWDIKTSDLQSASVEAAERATAVLQDQGVDDNSQFQGDIEHLNLRTLNQASQKLLIKNSISPLPLHKTLALMDCLKLYACEPYYNHLLLALAKAVVFSISNLRFGPEVGVGKIKRNTPVISPWKHEVSQMVDDLNSLKGRTFLEAEIYLADSRNLTSALQGNNIDSVITSPPYPNEKDYTRTTRLESVLLGFIENNHDLRRLKKTFIRSNTRGVYKDDKDDFWVADHPEINRIASEIENRRIELGKTSGFEKLYPRVTQQYFGGMARHLMELSQVLSPDAQLAYVVGDQASYLKVMIRTGKILASIAKKIGYKVEGIELFRTRFSTATKSELREEVVVLSWPG